MTGKDNAASKKRERTLLAAVLLSVWAPLATGYAVLVSRSTAQLADFIRRSVELLALVISWLVFRRLARGEFSPRTRARWQKTTAWAVAAALVVSGVAMLATAASRAGRFQPGGNVWPGLVIACLGLAVNTWFWQRYRRLHREAPDPIIAGQSNLYRAKALADFWVLAALAAVAAAPNHVVTRWLDVLGAGGVAVYLLASGITGAWRAGISGLRGAETRELQKTEEL